MFLNWLQNHGINVYTWEDALELTELDLSFNKLTSFPPEIWNLTKLKELDLSFNKLISLPPEIGNLTNLTRLNLRNNELTSLPAEIVNLTKLTTLTLYENKLTSLPPEIGKLTNLTFLFLDGNNLNSLPREIGLLTNLTQFWLFNNNNLTSLPLGLERLSKEIIDSRSRPLYESSVTRNKVRRTISALKMQRLWFKYWWVPNSEGVARKALYDWREIADLIAK